MNANWPESLACARASASFLRMRNLLFPLILVALLLGPVASRVTCQGRANDRIDWDEAKVRSVSTRAQTSVPTTEAANSSVTLSDTTSDLASTGTVTYSNPQFNLGALNGTATLSYEPGTSGGSITNCAHATGVPSSFAQQHLVNGTCQ